MGNDRGRPQRTLKKRVSFSGVGIHTGREVSLSFCPAPVNAGIVFRRVDLPNSPSIKAHVNQVQQTARSTTIGEGKAVVHTVEHVLAALYAYGIDNLVIEVTEAEPPVADGSSKPFVALIEEAGVLEQEDWAAPFILPHPVEYSNNEIHLVALPSDEYRISYTLNYPKTPVIRCQYFSASIGPTSFKKEIAPCRTFALYDEISALMQRGLIKGGSLENAVVVKDEVIFSKEGLRFPDEMVRHKILDLVGDLALVGFPIKAHIIAIRSGHRANVELAKRICKIRKTMNEKRS